MSVQDVFPYSGGDDERDVECHGKADACSVPGGEGDRWDAQEVVDDDTVPSEYGVGGTGGEARISFEELLRQRAELMAQREAEESYGPAVPAPVPVKTIVGKEQCRKYWFPSEWRRPLFIDLECRETPDNIQKLVYKRYPGITRAEDDKVHAVAKDYNAGHINAIAMFDLIEDIMNKGEAYAPHRGVPKLNNPCIMMGQDMGRAITWSLCDNRAAENAAKFGLATVHEYSDIGPRDFVYASSRRHLEVLQGAGVERFVLRRHELVKELQYVEHFWSGWFWCFRAGADLTMPPERQIIANKGILLAAPIGAFLTSAETSYGKQHRPALLARYFHSVMTSKLLVEASKYTDDEIMGPHKATVDRLLKNETRVRYPLAEVAKELAPHAAALDDQFVGRMNKLNAYIRRLNEKLVYDPVTQQFLRLKAIKKMLLSPTPMGERLRAAFVGGLTLAEAFIKADKKKYRTRRSNRRRDGRGGHSPTTGQVPAPTGTPSAPATSKRMPNPSAKAAVAPAPEKKEE